MKGRIISGRGGFYAVAPESGEAAVTCRLRGIFRKEGITPLPGDIVEFANGRVDAILPRRNVFIRPACANIDALVITACAAPPVPDELWLDKLTACAELNGAEAILAFNKSDLKRAEVWARLYASIGYASILVSAATGEGIAELAEVLRGKNCAFAGHSGAGKSSIINALLGVNAEVGEISERLGRGRHTTRHSELFPLGGGTWCADCPGFSSLEPGQLGMTRENLRGLFPEFRGHECRYADCAHVDEPDCGVKDAAERGGVAASRYESYVRIMRGVVG